MRQERPKQFKGDDNIDFAISTAKKKISTPSKSASTRLFEFYAVDRTKIEAIIQEAEKSRRHPGDVDRRGPARSISSRCPRAARSRPCDVGFLSAAELVDLISTKVGRDRELRPGIFSTNLRGYLGAGARVTSSIGAETLRSAAERSESPGSTTASPSSPRDGSLRRRRLLGGVKPPEKIKLDWRPHC